MFNKHFKCILQFYFTLDPFGGLLTTPLEIAASLIKFTHTPTQFLHPSFTLCSPQKLCEMICMALTKWREVLTKFCQKFLGELTPPPPPTPFHNTTKAYLCTTRSTSFPARIISFLACSCEAFCMSTSPIRRIKSPFCNPLFPDILLGCTCNFNRLNEIFAWWMLSSLRFRKGYFSTF